MMVELMLGIMFLVAAFTVMKLEKRLDDAEQVCAEAYQLVGSLGDKVPDAEKWLDNLAAFKLVHKDLLPLDLGD